MESSQRDIPNERDVRRPEGRDKLDKPNSPATRPKRSRRDKRDSGIDMLNGPLPGKILRFAIPLALSSILQQLLNSADASIAGQFVSSFSLAGIGGVNPVTAMFVNLFVGLSIGANVVVAMHVGAGEFHSIKKSVHTAMTLSLIAGVMLGAAGLALAPWVLDAIGMPEDSLADALTYVRLYFCAIPFLTIYNFGSALLRAHGDAKRPLYALAAAVVMNFVLDLAFVRLFSWGTAGIGIATIIAAALSAVIVVAFLMREEGPFRLHLRELSISGPELAGILRIGIPAGVQGAVFSLSNTVVQATINGFGSAAIAGSAATLNFEYYTYFFVNAFGQTAVTFTGQNFAAKNADRCRAIFRWCMLFGFASSLILGVAFTALGTRALGLFTTDAAALSFGLVRLWFVELPDCLTTFYEVPAGAMRGMGWSTLPAIITILGSCVLRVALVTWVFPLSGTWDALMVIYPVTWSFMIVAMLVSYVIVRRRCYRSIEPAAA